MIVCPAGATIFLWKGGTGNWKDDAKWAGPSGPPEKNDSVRIQVPGSVVNVTSNRKTDEIHDVTVGGGATLNILGSALQIYGNSLANDGTIYVGPAGFLRSHSKNLIVSGTGTIVMAGEIGGNMTIANGQTVRGSGAFGRGADRLFNDGIIVASTTGQNLTFYQAINGTGTFRSENGGGLVFTGSSSSDYLVANSRVQINQDFTVARDFQSSYFGSGNNFDAHRVVVGGGPILAADANQVVGGSRLSGGVIDFGVMRRGSSVSTDLVVSNTGTLTTLSGAIKNLGAPNVAVSGSDFAIGPGGSHAASLTFAGTTAGIVSGQTIDVANNFDNVADGHYLVQATVTDPAIAALAKVTGAGMFSGGGSDYLLDLGGVFGGTGPAATELAVLNAVVRSAFSEALGGAFSLTGDAGFSFSGSAFGALFGGDADTGNWISFDSSGLANGSYSGVLTFNGFSHYAGLSDLTLAPLRLTIRATVFGVPEPASWAMMIAGFGMVGGALRRRPALLIRA